VPYRKNQHCIFILSVRFCSETETPYILCTGGPSLGAKSGLADDFSQKMFPITPPGNGNVGMGPRDLWEIGFKVDENSPPAKKIASEISNKKKLLFSTFIAKNMFFYSRICCWIDPFLSFVTIVFQKFRYFQRWGRRFGSALYFVRALNFGHPL
jgi:hypothetical protein